MRKKKKKNGEENVSLTVTTPKAKQYAARAQEDSTGFADSMSDAFKQKNEKKFLRRYFGGGGDHRHSDHRRFGKRSLPLF